MSEQTPGPLETLRAANDVWKADLSSAVARVFKWVLTVGIVGIVGAAGLGAWRYSDAILQDSLSIDSTNAVTLLDDGNIVEISDSGISLAPSAEVSAIARNGSFGLKFPGGSGVVGPLLTDGSVVARQWTPVEGTPAEGMRVGIDRNTYMRDPLQDFGIPFEEVMIPSPGAAELPSWYVEGDRSTWVIITHDVDRDLAESLRTLPLFTGRGFPVLAISYSTDQTTFADEDAVLGYGLTEWRDIQAAVDWSRQRGAKRFILVGYGMGGGATIEFVKSSPFGGQVSGVMLDAPALDLGVVIDSDPNAEEIPQILRSLGKTIATFRFGVNWSELNYLEKFDSVKVPVLLAHGVDDEVVPVDLSDQLAERYPARLTYLRVDGAGHGESWNVATAEYESAVQQFLTDVLVWEVQAKEEAVNRPGQSDGS